MYKELVQPVRGSFRKNVASSATQQSYYHGVRVWRCLTYWRSSPVVQGTLQGALLSSAKHGGVNSDLHTPFAAQPHPLLLTDHLTLILVWREGEKEDTKGYNWH